METHEQTKQYCLQVIDDCLEKNDELSEMIWGIFDTMDTWDQAIDSINQAINRKAKELAILNPQPKFKTFRIRDMRRQGGCK